MNDRVNKPAEENIQAQPASELDKLLRELREFLNPMPPTEGMGLAEMMQNIEGIKDALGFKRK